MFYLKDLEALKNEKLACHWQGIIFVVNGPEHREWLHRISSNQVLNMPLGSMLRSAFLNAGGGSLARFHLWLKSETESWLFCEAQNEEAVAKYLEQSHFGEDLSFHKLSTPPFVTELQGKVEAKGEGVLSIAGFRGVSDGAYVLTSEQNTLKDLRYLSNADMDLVKAYYGLYKDGVDVLPANIILEAGYDDFVSDVKGCYPGQEVIAKVYTYGRLAKRVVRLFSPMRLNEKDIFMGTERAGAWTSQYILRDGVLLVASLKRIPLEKAEAGNAHFYSGQQILQLLEVLKA